MFVEDLMKCLCLCDTEMEKIMKKKVLIIFTLFFYIISVPVGIQASNEEIIFDVEISNSETILRAANIVWVHKRTNGVLYKRRYNKTSGKWIGDWIRV